MKTSQKKAFTLAEVLIALGIVGMIAAVTMPAVMSSFKKKQQFAAFKNIHSVLNQMLKTSRTQNGPIKNWNFATFDTTDKSFKKFVLPYIDINKDCGTANAGCFAPSYKLMSGGVYSGLTTDFRKVLLANGTALAYRLNSNTCITVDGNPSSARATNPSTCATFIIDVNGVESPNQMGRDIFEFQLYQFVDLINPTGVLGSTYSSASRTWPQESISTRNANCSKSGSGTMCGAKLLEDNEIKY